ncbi:MAG TPA: hypothetical protein VK175_18720 [Leadbetterella sp.]|nr:hypothetical protein [Leadbetterella sp.]
MDYTKTFFGKDDSTYKCLKALRKERYHLRVNNSGNITDQIFNPGLNYNYYEFIDGMPCKVSKNDLASSNVFLTFYDFNEKVLKSYTTKLRDYFPDNFTVIESVKLLYLNDSEYYFYGILKRKNEYRLFVVKLSKGEVIDFKNSEIVYQINDVYSPKLLPNGDIFFICSVNDDFLLQNRVWLVKYSRLSNELFFSAKLNNIEGDLGPTTNLIYRDKELLILPLKFLQNNKKLTAYGISTSDYSITEKIIQIPDQGTTTGIKVFETQLGQYIGYTNNKNEIMVSKLNTDFSLKPAFKVNSLELSSMVTINNADRVYEFDPPKQTGDAVETKMRVHTGLGTYRDLVLFRGVGYRDTCN